MSKVNVTPKNLYENRNTSDVFSRLVIMGILRILNSQLSYTQIWDNTEDGIQNVTVPFFFDFTGGSVTGERFIQDNYMNWTDDECTMMGLKKVNGDYKPIPYGVITLESTNLESSQISNRFVMGQFQKKINNEMKSYVAFLYSIPLTMTFGVNIVCDTMNTMWKIEQAYREYFYKNKTFRFNYKGTVCHARVGFPESITENKTMQYQMGNASGDGHDIKLSFSLQCETYQPVFDKNSEMPADQIIKSFGTKIMLNETGKHSTENGVIRAKTDLSGKYIVTEEDILLEWDFIYNYSDLLYIDILYSEDGETYETIETNVENHNCYHLQLPEDFMLSDMMFDVMVENNENAIIVNQPAIKFYVNPETNIVDETTCVVINKGFILTELPYINAILSYYDKSGNLHEYDMQINILNNAIDTSKPITIKPFIYNNDVQYKKIKLFVRDHANPDKIAAFQQEDEWIYIF
ncbi:MAG: hypothetical protein [Wendovervirus sonii]|uniref:Distal tail protein n=1 Tax=phage Lak_Megaphage_Sonny TaxID=3109229 RepID=A0ABZ0Z3K1_9CAUD|nr:MAG: hypothetical protein [phage Lak_Megaphage_Sonny]